MASQPPPKAILFDIGGVCVVSPFQAILDYELAHSIPPGYINFAIQKGPHDTGAWQLIERGEAPLDDAWFAAFGAQLSVPAHWGEFWRSKTEAGRKGGAPVPGVPAIDAKALFWEMMRTSRVPDPWMYPAVKRLGACGRFVIGALSNTVAFPEGVVDDRGEVYTRGLLHAGPPNPHAGDSADIAECFDVYISSAHVGVRKPDPAAYELAVRELDRVAREKGRGGVAPGDVLFLDDIGVNLKWARKSGLRTIKVDLGRTREAVRELEIQTGERLLEDTARL